MEAERSRDGRDDQIVLYDLGKGDEGASFPDPVASAVTAIARRVLPTPPGPLIVNA